MTKIYSHLLTAVVFSAACVLNAQTVGTVINAADASTAFSPGMVVLIRGTNLSTSSATISSLPAPTALGGVSVQFTASDGSTSLLPLLSVSPSEIRAQLPYDVATGPATVSVGSSTVTVTLVALAPRLITDFQNGNGDLLMFHSNPQRQVTRQDPAQPGETVWIYAHGLGQTNPPVLAGADPGLNPSPAVQVPVAVSVDGLQTQVNETSLLELNPGVYKISVTLPYDDKIGTVPVLVTVGGVSAQTDAVVPLMPNGFYYQILANNPPTPIALNGLSGPTSSLATRHADLNYWGPNGFLNWTKVTGLGAPFEPIRGIALTLRSGDATVFVNHGIEDKNGTFYTNSTGGPDGSAPGLLTIYSMSNLYPFIGGGFFRLSQAVTFDTLMGYFDGNGDRDLPLNPDSPYIKYRMNIWSNVPTSNAPLETGSFTGDVWTSDTSSGTWSWSYTGVDRVFRDTRTLNSDPSRRDDPIFRLVYKLDNPITLQAGSYWFSHDAVVPSSVGAFGFSLKTAPGDLKSITSIKAPAPRDGASAGQRVQPPAVLRINP